MAKEKKHTHTTRIRPLIIAGYLTLSLLAFYGVYRVYAEFKKFSVNEPSFEERKELVMVGNLLSSLYEAENMNRLFFAEMAQPESMDYFNSLNTIIRHQIDSLHKVSSDALIRSRLDSVSALLDLKYANTINVFLLMDSINKIPLEKKSITTILSRRELDSLRNITKLYVQGQQDTTITQVKRKSFLKRLSDVFKDKTVDSVLVSSSKSSMTVDSILPVHVVSVDTITQYLTSIMMNYDKRRNELTYRLSMRQNQLFLTNERLTAQINNILYNLEMREYRRHIAFLSEKKAALKRSSAIALRVAWGSMITAILFLGLSLFTLSREQRYRNRLESAKKYAEDLSQKRERLMLAISHDIKAPLSSIIGYLELFAKSKLPAKERYYLENMQKASENVLELVTNLLDYHRLESGKQELRNVYFSPHRLLNDLYLAFKPLAEKKGLILECINRLNPAAIHYSDPLRIRQIASNLLSNAVKFTDRGKVTLMAFIVAQEEETLLVMIVKDTGCGIEKENQESIFDEFLREKDADIRSIEGSGLGLAITKESVSLLNGNIRLQSEKNKGAEFTVTLPIKDGKDPIVRRMNENRKNIKILFIEDDPALLNVYAELLKNDGCSPTVCSKPAEALEIIRKTPFDIIFSDIQMPGINGFELAERIRSSDFPHAGTIPVIAFSARSDVSEQQLLEAGFSGFLAKPFTLEQLLESIARHIDAPPRAFVEKPVFSENGFGALTSFARKDKNAALQIIRTFAQENEASIEKMRKALSENDWGTIRACAHKLTPLMQIIQANEIVEILRALENGLKNKRRVKTALNMIIKKNNEAKKYLTNNCSQ